MQAETTFPIAGAWVRGRHRDAAHPARHHGGTRIDLDTRSRTITMRDTPERLALAGELIQQLQRARGEVMLEIEILEVDATKPALSELHLRPPSSSLD